MKSILRRSNLSKMDFFMVNGPSKIGQEYYFPPILLFQY